MQKSRLYLSLALVSLVAGAAVAEFGVNLRCPLSAPGQCPAYRCGVQRTKPPANAMASYSELYHAAIGGRFDSAIELANVRLQADGADAATRLFLAYALRGKGDLNSALGHYKAVTAQLADAAEHEDWLMIDALTGQAACLIALGQSDLASADLEEALKLAKRQEKRDPDARSAYQLACVNAQLAAVHEATEDTWQTHMSADRAAAYLKLAMDRGYANRSHIEADLDLDPVREHTSFLAVWR